MKHIINITVLYKFSNQCLRQGMARLKDNYLTLTLHQSNTLFSQSVKKIKTCYCTVICRKNFKSCHKMGFKK